MNVIGYICCALGFVSIISLSEAINNPDEKFYDSLPMDILAKAKRPFCNAFTGCGKKRSFYPMNPVHNQEETSDQIRVPVPVYRALLRAASRDTRRNFDQQLRMENAPDQADHYSYSGYTNNNIPSANDIRINQ